ncbi:hypothetical protein GCM10017044_22910 [Kordiimonas sediminis]|uniref:DUF1579 domain-containing protein n=1 Tax=Kordiimonas sediminis TaxID=1735581 RepID=A0A919AUT9_9PROT|nr:hypothetical protein [Kordiimonas sediminis]GHF27279.1 hypothetical protein GCM10017044_22910 [Kordiimonas sediminis]
MKKKFIFIFTLIAGVVSMPTHAQATADNICDAPPFHDFDFWLGDWEVTDASTGKVAGENTIVSIENNCALLETWTSATGGTGRSLNFYNPESGKWRQLWISAGAYSIDFDGGLKDGSMVLEGTIWYYQNNQTEQFRGTWTLLEDGSVRQFMEQYNRQTNMWDVWFNGIYKRK